MTPDPGDRRRDSLVLGAGRQLMFVLWSLIAWGTFVAAALVWSTITKGVATTWHQALSRDVPGGGANLALAGCAVLVWAVVSFAVWKARRKR